MNNSLIPNNKLRPKIKEQHCAHLQVCVNTLAARKHIIITKCMPEITRLQKHFYFKSVFKEYDLSKVLLGPLQMKGEKWINNKEHTD